MRKPIHRSLLLISIIAAVMLAAGAASGTEDENCLNCHVPGGAANATNVSAGDLGTHTNLNTTGGTGTLTNGDCWTCHYAYPNGTSGSHSFNVSKQNTYYCEDCHGPVKNSTVVSQGKDAQVKVLSDFFHGKSYADGQPRWKDCEMCHSPYIERYDPDGARLKNYHNKTPLGKVANTGWYGWSPGNVPVCNDCHQARNLDDTPFHAPGKDHYVNSCADNCHEVSSVHTVYMFGDLSWLYGISPPQIAYMSVQSPVTRGSTATITVEGKDNYLQVEVTQYRVKNGSGVQIGWTNMAPRDGTFNTRDEYAVAGIDTSGLSPGSYTVEAKVMASGPRTDQTRRAYMYNGAWSGISNRGLTVN